MNWALLQEAMKAVTDTKQLDWEIHEYIGLGLH